MGKDKKEKNPADAFRKDQRKKELLKLKKDREVVKGVRDLLNDPRKIDEEIAKAQKISDENKLDKSLKDKIKELQRMKDVANARQLVLAAQGKKSLAEAESIIKPSIYQKNEGVWDDPNGKKAASSSHGHVKSASRISTEGLAPYTRGEDANLAAQMPIPTSIMMPYPAPVPGSFPRGPAGVVPGGMAGRGPVMGGVAGIPLPPPRPVAGMDTYNPALMQGYAVPPPPPRPGMLPVGGLGGVPPPPGPPPAHLLPNQAQFPPAAFPPQMMYGYAGMGVPVPGMMQAPMYGYPPQFAPQPGFGGPPVYQHHQQQQQPPRGPPAHQQRQQQQQQKERKPRAPRGSVEEVDPLDPAGRGYTERFGAAQPVRKVHSQPSSHEDIVMATVEPPPALLPVTVNQAGDAAVQHDDQQQQQQQQMAPALGVSPPPPPPPPSAPTRATFVAPGYAALSAEEIMRRRHMVPSEAEVSVDADLASSPSSKAAPGPAPSFSFSYPTLSAEELLRRRHQLPVEDLAEVVDCSVADDFVPSRPPVSYGAVLSAEELMRRRYMVQEAAEEIDTAAGPSMGPSAEYNDPSAGEVEAEEEQRLRRRFEVPPYAAEDVDSDQDDHSPTPGPARGPPAAAHYSYQSYRQSSGVEEADSEELMRQRYEIPDMQQAEDVDEDDDDENRKHGGYVSEDDVRSAGEPEPAFDDDEVVRSDQEEEGEEEDPDAEPLQLNLRNLYPARLPASFTALPQSRVSYPLPGAAPAPAPRPSSSYSSAINFNDYGDDEDEDEEVQEPVAPRVQPYAVSVPQAPAVLPARAPENFPVSSYYPEGVESAEIPHAVVKGPKIVKTDRALTAFVPNAIKKKRLHNSTIPAVAFSTFRKPAIVEQVAAVEGEEEDVESEHAPKAARHESAAPDYTASLHAATSALFRPSAAPAPAPSAPSAGRAPIAPIAFVPATASTVSVSKAATAAPPPTSAEEDAMALFFSEINQLEGV